MALRSHGGALGLAAALLLAPAWAQPDTREPPPLDEADLGTVPVEAGLPDEAVPGWSRLEWSLGGNIQVDALLGSDLPQPRTKTAELRRLRLSGVLEWDFDWLLKAGGDAANGGRIRDLSVEYRGWPVYLEAGRIVEPLGVLQGSSRSLALMERPLATGLAPGFGLGVAASARGERWGASGGIYSATDNDELNEGGRKENAVTLRGTLAALRREDAMIHVGAAGSLRESHGGTLQFVAIPETVLLRGLNTSSQELFSGSASENISYQLYGLELASMLGPVLIQSEFLVARLGEVFAFAEDLTLYRTRPTYSGFYVETAWAITGERRDYSTRRGMFSGLWPEAPLSQGGRGAVEAALRFSAINLMDGNLGGEGGFVASLGLNWHAEPWLKCMLDTLYVEEDRITATESAYALQARVQATFSVP